MNIELFHQSILTKEGRIFVTSLQKKLKAAGLLEAVQQVGHGTLVERYYWFYHNLTDYPKRCKVCSSALTKFGGFHIGYLHDTCSARCAALDKVRQEKTKNTIFEKYGVQHHMELETVKEKIKRTNVSRYGVESPLNTVACKNGLQAKYGVSHISQSTHWKEKTKITFDEKYNGRGFSGTLVQPAKETLEHELGLERTNFSYQQLASWVASKRKLIIDAEHAQFNLISFDCNKRELILEHSCAEVKTISFETRGRLRCFKCHPVKFSSFEQEVFEFITSLGVYATRSDRNVIKPLELDILIPDSNLAVECNGDYWHSYSAPETKEERQKHLLKLTAAEKVGLTLMQIAEHEWREKQDLIKSMLRVKLGKANRIYARKTTLREISQADAVAFCNENHIQGGCWSAKAIGAFYNGELVSCITIGKNRFVKNGSTEIIRFACKKNLVIVGVLSKFIEELKKHTSGVLESYLDRRLFNGASLFNTGWKLERTSQPGYCWLLNGERISRSRTQKHRLHKLLGAEFNPSLSEAANMFNAGADRLWDCGQHVFSFQL